MTKHCLLFVLILMMLITPIASAFDHCIGMNMSGHLSESQSLTATMSANEVSPSGLNQILMEQGQQNNQTKMDCECRYICMLHEFDGFGLTSLALTVDTLASSYAIFDYIAYYSVVVSPDLRPPKLILS